MDDPRSVGDVYRFSVGDIVYAQRTDGRFGKFRIVEKAGVSSSGNPHYFVECIGIGFQTTMGEHFLSTFEEAFVQRLRGDVVFEKENSDEE